MGKKKFLIPMVAFGVMMPAMFMLSACGKSGTPSDTPPETPAHVHTYSEDWSKNTTNHWHACTGEDCDATTGDATHTFSYSDLLDDTHTSVCSVCGHTSVDSHTWVLNWSENTHWKECSICLKTKDDVAHVYDDESDFTCNDCDYTRTQTTLAFKSGTYAVTYNGVVQAFDKANLVDTNVSLDDVKVEYSTTKTDDSWTETAPKDAGKYYIRLSVASNDLHTGLTIISEENQALTINKKELSLAELKWVYAKDQLKPGYGSYTTLTHADISGIVGEDKIEVKWLVPSGSTITENSEWTLRDTNDTTHMENSFACTLSPNVDTSNKNYKLSSTEVGKVLVAKDMTTSGSGTTTSPYTYTKTESIDKDQVVYYAAKLTRTKRNSVAGEEFFVDEYTLSITSGVEIVEVITHDKDFCVTINADGSVIMYGDAEKQYIIFAVKYTGEEDSISNTLTLTENTITRTIADQSKFENALNLSEGAYKVVIKKNGSVIQEQKHQDLTGYSNYYQYYHINDQETETYHTLTNNEYYMFEKTNDVWTRSAIDVTEDYGTIADVKAELLADILASINDINTSDAFAKFTFSEEDLMYHITDVFTINGVDMTHIALKFEDGKLLYVEYTDGTDIYTMEITNSADGVTVDLPISGLFKTHATSVPYVTDGGNFALDNVTLFKGDNWFELDITQDYFNANSYAKKCEILGEFKTSDDATFTITVENASGTTINNIASESNEFDFEISAVGKYYIKVNVTADCTGAWDIGFADLIPEEGKTKEKAISVDYYSGGYSQSNIVLSTRDKWIEIEITNNTYLLQKNSDTDGCTLSGSITLSDASGATITFSVEDASGKTLTSTKDTSDGSMTYTNLTVGKYYIKISATSDCTCSLNLSFVKIGKM